MTLSLEHFAFDLFSVRGITLSLDLVGAWLKGVIRVVKEQEGSKGCSRVNSVPRAAVDALDKSSALRRTHY